MQQRPQEEKDREERVNSNRKQMDIAKDLAKTTGAEITRLLSLQKESELQRHRIAELEKENRELRRANDILKAASVFFATELDGRPKK